MEAKIKWNEGEGYITATYEGSGNGSATISSDVNEGIDRVQSITVETTQGSEPKSEFIQVTQIGLREVFEPSDGGFVLADGGTLNVVKYVILPSGYKSVEYIEFTGTQYIDTGFVPNQDTRVVMGVYPTSSSPSFLYGARYKPKSDSFALVIYNNKIRMDYGSEQVTVDFSPTQMFSIDMNKNVAVINGVTYTSSASTFESPCPMSLLAVNTNGTVGSFAKARLYSCQIYDNGVLVRDYMPCIDTEGSFGLYDLVGDLFYKLKQ